MTKLPPEFKNYRVVLQSIKKSGNMPTLELFYSELGISTNQFRNIYNNKIPLAIEIKNEYNKVRKHWEENGGNVAIVMHKALKSLQKQGEKPTYLEVCRIANTSFPSFRKLKYPWSKNLYSDISQAILDYKDGINNAIYDKCLDTLDEMTKEGEFPTKMTLAKKAGYHSKIFDKDDSWRQKIVKAIDATLKDYTKLDPLYIDINILIDKITSKEPVDLSQIGISFNEVDEHFTLAHIMCSEHLLGTRPYGKQLNFYIKEKSFTTSRSHLVKGIIMACEGIPQKTITAGHYLPYIIKAAIWIGSKPLNTIYDARKLFVDFSEEFKKLIKSGEKSHITAFNSQRGLIRLLDAMGYEENDITCDNTSLIISQTVPKSNAYSNTAKFSQEELEYAFAFYYHLFKQLAETLLENKQLPQPIKLPGGNILVLGIGQTLFINHKNKNGSIAIDHTDGHLISDEEIETITLEKSKIQKTPKSAIKKNLLKRREETLKKLNEINATPTHPIRLQLGTYALDAWFMSMLFFTAMNDSTLGTLTWGDSDEFEPEQEQERKEFYNIKPRAGYKGVRFALPKACIKDFKEFLKLRRFVLNTASMPYLFFKGFDKNARYTKLQSKGQFSSFIKEKMKLMIDSNLPDVCSRDSRVDHSRDTIQKYGLNTALHVLQNKEETLIRHYNGQTAEDMAKDISKFLESVHENVINDTPIDETQSTATGGCGSNKQEPQTIEGSPVEANCDDQRSCIFCFSFKTFPEPDYIRKLLSLQYIIENMAYDNAPSDEYYEKEMNPWLVRINALLKHMKKSDEFEAEQIVDEMIKQITEEVFADGLLSPYWLMLSEFYEETGMFS